MGNFRATVRNQRPDKPGRWLVKLGEDFFLHDHWNTWTSHGPAASVARSIIHEYAHLARNTEEVRLLSYDGKAHTFDTKGNHIRSRQDVSML